MKSQTVYYEIFELAIKELSSRYGAGMSTPTSGDFENVAEESIKTAIEKWNSGRSAKEQKVIETHHFGGAKFPDIVLHNKSDGEKIGLEVKLHSKGKAWKTTGNSAISSTQVPDLEVIYLLFGHFGFAIPEFKIKPIDQCICKLEVTHKPRYQIDMDYKDGDFCEKEIGISYNQLRTLKQEYRSILVFSCVARREYTEIYQKGKTGKNKLIAQSFVLFPELFSSTPRKRYKRLTEWFFAQNILVPNIRDNFSSRGKAQIKAIGQDPLPKVYSTLYMCRKQFLSAMKRTPEIILKHYWDKYCSVAIPTAAEERIKQWIDIVCAQYGGAQKEIRGTPYTFRDTIEKIIRV